MAKKEVRRTEHLPCDAFTTDVSLPALKSSAHRVCVVGVHAENGKLIPLMNVL